jgi:hypothetical protein
MFRTFRTGDGQSFHNCTPRKAAADGHAAVSSNGLGGKDVVDTLSQKYGLGDIRPMRPAPGKPSVRLHWIQKETLKFTRPSRPETQLRSNVHAPCLGLFHHFRQQCGMGRLVAPVVQ